MSRHVLQEYLSPSANQAVCESVTDEQGGKSMYMKGIFIQGGVRNANQRIYPVKEIERAVGFITESIKNNVSILGECDHPDDLKINLDRVTHVITEMWMDGANGFGKLKILPTPMGNVVKTMLENNVRLGVSSRGSGNVNEATGHVSEFEIVTVDIVAQPSAPNAYPTVVYEGLRNMKHGDKILEIADEVRSNPRVQKYLQEEVVRLIKELKIK